MQFRTVINDTLRGDNKNKHKKGKTKNNYNFLKKVLSHINGYPPHDESEKHH